MKFWEAMKALEEGKKVYAKNAGFSRGMLAVDFGILSKLEWVIHEEPEKTYSFREVVKGLKEGKKFKRKGWEEFDDISLNGNEVIRDTLETYHAFFNDFEATDWIEVK